LPEKLILTTGKGSEREVLRQHLRPGSTYVVDRGYNSYDLFDHLDKMGCHFVTRLLSNASFELVSSSALSSEQQIRFRKSDHYKPLGISGELIKCA
jgi:hypothetical protein